MPLCVVLFLLVDIHSIIGACVLFVYIEKFRSLSKKPAIGFPIAYKQSFSVSPTIFPCCTKAKRPADFSQTASPSKQDFIHQKPLPLLRPKTKPHNLAL